MADEIEIVEYDAAWPGLFEAERRTLERVPPAGLVLTIEHAGSTAIPGLAAKPIIDIFLAVTSINAARAALVEPIKSLGYVYWEDNPDRSAMFFVKGMPPFGVRRTHHIHVMQPDVPRWERVMLFRDYLRENPEEATTYLALKHDLARQHANDREAYTRAKDTYVAAVVQRAREGR
jgi:GrpB-like predicted nucleotidyltransferase (UPF0157 family)